MLCISAASCQKAESPKAQLEVSQTAQNDGAVTVRAVIPAGLSASELVSYNTLAANAIVIQTSRQEQAFALEQARLQVKQEAVRRRDYLLFAIAVVIMVNVTGILVAVVLFKYAKGGHK